MQVAGFKLLILTPKGKFFEDEVESVKFSNNISRIEVLPGHINYMSEIIPSLIEIKQNGISKKAVASNGVFEFSVDKATILLDAAEWPEQIDLERALNAQDRAKDRMKSRDISINMERADLALQRAVARIKCCQEADNANK
jgi:F-type H+-transporting ATPase subunit epsilon